MVRYETSKKQDSRVARPCPLWVRSGHMLWAKSSHALHQLSINWSARSSTAGGMVRPTSLAVFRDNEFEFGELLDRNITRLRFARPLLECLWSAGAPYGTRPPLSTR